MNDLIVNDFVFERIVFERFVVETFDIFLNVLQKQASSPGGVGCPEAQSSIIVAVLAFLDT